MKKLILTCSIMGLLILLLHCTVEYPAQTLLFLVFVTIYKAVSVYE